MAVAFLTLTSLAACISPSAPGVADTSVSLAAAGITVEFPHSDRFKKTVFHGTQYLAAPFQCAGCHGTDFSGGSASVSCKNCHTNFPHDRAWAKPVNHGKTFFSLADDKRKQCLVCHGVNPAQDPVNADKIPKCTDCHKAYPHDYQNAGFRDGAHKDLATSYDGKCLACHHNATDNMPNSPAGCVTCHEGKVDINWKQRPHDQGWAKPQVHGKAYAALAHDGRMACLKCHSTPSADPTNVTQTPACVDCHKAYPHDTPVDEHFKNGKGSHPAQAKDYSDCTLCHRKYLDNMPYYGPYGGCIFCHTGNPEIGWKKVTPASMLQGL